MYSAAFIFEPGQYDDRFHALDALIESAARANPGFLGSENWQSADGKRINATYYWRLTLNRSKSSPATHGTLRPRASTGSGTKVFKS